MSVPKPACDITGVEEHPLCSLKFSKWGNVNFSLVDMVIEARTTYTTIFRDGLEPAGEQQEEEGLEYWGFLFP